MITWHKNVPLREEDITRIKTSLTEDKYEPLSNIYTSFYSSHREEKFLSDFYYEVIAEFMKSIHLYHKTRYSLDFWCQMYLPNQGGHVRHHHFGGHQLFSFVHFIKSPDKCFRFETASGDEYPESQNDGDFIVFPSWATHGVDTNRGTEERIVVAGNVLLDYMEHVYEDTSRCLLYCNRLDSSTVTWRQDILPPAISFKTSSETGTGA
jgi:hypothetical protein